MSASDNNGKIQYMSFTSECYRRLLADILSNKISWRERLDIPSLAEAYGVSRSPVVKAIEQLDREGLVEIIPNKGSYIRTPTKKDVIEISEIRFACEAMNVVLAYRKHKQKLLSQLAKQDQIMAAFEQKNEEIPAEIFLAYDRKFHWTFAELADNSRLLAILEVNRNQVELFRIRTYSPSKSKHSIARHREVVHLLQDDQVDAAVHALRQHIFEVAENAIVVVLNEGSTKTP